MFITKKHLARRTFLKTAGAALALPFLDSMVPALTAQTRTAANANPRLGFVYVPHGAIMDRWTPKTEGAGFEFSPILQALEPFRDAVNVISGGVVGEEVRPWLPLAQKLGTVLATLTARSPDSVTVDVRGELAAEDVTVLYVRTGVKGYEEVDPAEVQRRYGVPPASVPDFIALRGDPSDGLPGAKGVGEKTAAELLRAHGSLEAALDAWPRVRPVRVAGALRDQRDELLVFKDIATLRATPVELPADAPTDFHSGARTARSAGMERLARRLDDLDG